VKLFDLFDRRDLFRTQDEIRDCIKNSISYEGEDASGSQLLLFFSTSKQRTYLVATKVRLYCVLDDSRKTEPRINWSIGKADLIHDGELKISIEARDVDEYTGLVNIGTEHKRWYFTKGLFGSRPIEKKIRSFILSSMK
jgi:hypothetical protein